MKNANKIITITVTILATALISSTIITLFISGKEMADFLVFFLISLLGVTFLVMPTALVLNHYFKKKTSKHIAIKLALHFIIPIFIVAAVLLISGEKDELFTDDSIIFYLVASFNSLINFGILSLLKLTGDTDM
ncbi:hypothetical protein I6N90_07475 [Paenibacillus sp. GSMTC-2017]|uniref:hypothetical protein n=1 Tax=Paenibacillus sp. GSMTC-2017 TaxID=2794350 RepID=UPI0018D85715|nr:hypothetical protein [Paenibacillus sp. GSMTC-2017]MBH5317640.1 hypothetical protein [Paenibacillus sp. GSMTC-2017]